MKRRIIIELDGSSETVKKMEKAFDGLAGGLFEDCGLEGYSLAKENVTDDAVIRIPDFITRKHGAVRKEVV